MNYQINQYTINLQLDTTNAVDLAFLKQYKPYKYNQDIYIIPLTLTALNTFIKHFNLDKTNQEILSWILYLKSCLNYNYLDIKTNDNNLRDYQYQGVKWSQYRLLQSCAIGLFWEPRTGKTRTTTHIANAYNKVICCALSGQELNWVNNFQQFTNKTVLNIAKKAPKKRMEIYNEFNNLDNVVLIGSINTIANDILTNKKAIKLYDCLIIDEIHKAKNFKTKLNKGIRGLINASNKIIGLTGTPVSKNEAEILNLISLLFKGNFSKSFIGEYFFEKEYNDYSNYGSFINTKLEKRQEWLEFLSLYFSKIDKSIALPWINTPEIEVINLSMEKKQLKMYEKCLYDFEVDIENDTKQIQEIIAQFTYLRQISTHPILLGHNINSIKEEWLLDFLNNYIGDGVIVFSNHTMFLKHLHQKLYSKYEPLLITGETTNKTNIANQFQLTDTKILLANILAASKGLTLDKADTIIFLDIDWKPDENKQAIERFSATTPQKEKFRKVIYLQIDNKFNINGYDIESIDKYMYQINENKISQTELINNFKELFKEKLGV